MRDPALMYKVQNSLGIKHWPSNAFAHRFSHAHVNVHLHMQKSKASIAIEIFLEYHVNVYELGNCI